MADINLSVSEATLSQLRELAEWEGVPVEEALRRAVKNQHDQKFWDAVNAGYASLRADPKAWAEVEAERKQWDATLMDGLDREERWADDALSPGGAADGSPG
jgi:hypothetical protein